MSDRSGCAEGLARSSPCVLDVELEVARIARGIRAEVWTTMRLITGVLAAIGLAVVLVVLLAVGVFAYDEAKRRLVGDEFAPESPTGGSGD